MMNIIEISLALFFTGMLVLIALDAVEIAFDWLFRGCKWVLNKFRGSGTID